jgi:hypothetical protein
LVQDWDLDDDGKPETLRLLFATPKRWLDDGNEIKVERAPTAFGPVSIHTQSLLSKGKIIADLKLPTRNDAKHILLRARIPEGWHLTGATAGEKKVQIDPTGAIDLTGLKGSVSVQFTVSKQPRS